MTPWTQRENNYFYNFKTSTRWLWYWPYRIKITCMPDLKKKLIASTIFSTNHFTLPSTIRAFEIPTKVKLDPNENRPYFDNLINAQWTRRHGIHRQNKQLNGLVSCCRIMLRLIKWHVYAHKMHQISGPLYVNWWQCCHKIFLPLEEISTQNGPPKMN